MTNQDQTPSDQRDMVPQYRPAGEAGEATPIPQPQQVRVPLPLSTAWASRVLLVLNLAIFAVPFLLDLVGVRLFGYPVSDVIRAFGAKNNAAIAQDGEYWRFLTSMFLHGNLLHMAFNAYALYLFGPEAERIFGTGRFLALYFIAGLAGGVASYAFSASNSVGASGAIFGLIGGLAAFYYVARNVLGQVARQQLGSLITVIMINLFLGLNSQTIDNMAHMGGLAGGAVLGFLLAPRFELDERLFPPQVVRNSLPLAWPAAIGIAVLLVLAVMVIAPPLA